MGKTKPINNGGELWCCGIVNTYCTTCDTHYVYYGSNKLNVVYVYVVKGTKRDLWPCK
jgi:hypothetical protein